MMTQMVKNLPAMQETQVQILGQEDTLGNGMATNSSIFAWRIPWTESLAGYSPWGYQKSQTQLSDKIITTSEIVKLMQG